MPNSPGVADWLAPPCPCSIVPGEVHVWRARLDRDPEGVRRLWATLAPEERARAERFHFPRHRDQFIVGRGLLRAILGDYLGREPADLRFGYGTQGKPELLSGPGDDHPRFNLSHSGGLALYAVTRDREVGVDVEAVRARVTEQQLAERFFSPDEVARLRSLPASDQHEAFFHCWARKEAYIKATGRGLSLPLDGFSVSLAPGEPAELRSTPWNSSEVRRWSLLALAAGPGYAAALAVEGTGWSLRCWQVPDGWPPDSPNTNPKR